MSSGHVQEDYPLVGSYDSGDRRKWLWVGVIAFVCWNILLFSLAVAAIAKVNNIHESSDQSPNPVPYTQSVKVSAANTIPQMNVVSLLPDGTARSGAGTTIYSKTSPPAPFGVGSQNVRVARFVDEAAVDHVIVAWTNNTGSFVVLGTLSLDKQSVNAWYQPMKLPFDTFFDMITLANYHFIIATDKSVWAGTANVNPGAMNVTALASAPYPEAPVWRDIRLTALGISNFVVSYDTGFISVNSSTTFGAVVGSVVWNIVNKSPNITFVSQVETWQGGFPVHDVFALDSTSFVLVYASPAVQPTNETYVPPQLACSYCRFTAGSQDALSIKSTTVYAGIEPQFHLSAVGLDSTTGVVLVVDKMDEYALRAIAIHRDPNLIDGLHFGDVKTVESGIADSSYSQQFENGIVPFIDSARVSANKVTVAWADYGNQGRLTTAILTLDQSANIHVSPLFVIGQPMTKDQLKNYSVSVAGLSIDAFGQIGAVVIDRKTFIDNTDGGSVALVEVGPKAFGVAVHNAFQGNSVQVAVNGLVDLPSSFPTDLKPGYLYYGRTDGSLLAGGLAGSVDRSAQYVTLEDGSIVTTDSAVGVAVSKRQLYVLPSY